MSADPKTYEDLNCLVPSDVANHIHIIVGPNGKCLCGDYEGRAYLCSDIAGLYFPEIKSAIMTDHICPGGVPIDDKCNPIPLLP